MSLIREALEQARRQSSAPAPRLPGAPIPWSAASRTKRSPLGLALIVALAAAIGGGAVVWWITRPPAPPPATEAAQATVPAPPPSPAPPATEPSPPRREAADTILRPGAETAAAAATVASDPIESAAPRPHNSPFVSAPTRYVGALPLPEGGTLTLDGVVSSATNPVVVINGRLLSPGDFVQGFEIAAIGADHVVLRRDGRSITLTLR